ncbi:MAG: RNA-binding cell elongation regulator Jag/EloR [Patescibacteria group bacterium]
MRSVEKVGRTKEEAVRAALRELGIGLDEARVEIVRDEANSGFLGLLQNKKVRVKVTATEDVAKTAARFLREVLVGMEVTARVEVLHREDQVVLNVTGSELGILIGRHGQTLDALQYLVNLAANKGIEEKQRIVVDVQGYRQRHEESLRRLACHAADKVRQQRRKIVLSPMTPQERRIIHVTLQDNKDVFTYSEGQDPFRRVIVSPHEPG